MSARHEPPESSRELGTLEHNVEWKFEGTKLIVTMDISKQNLDEATPSASGKTFLVASTGGSMPIPCMDAKSLSLATNLMAKK
jgi:hypothetical protein